MSHEKMQAFNGKREPHQAVTVRQRNEGKVQCGLMQAGTHVVLKTWSTRGEDNIVHDVIVYLNPTKVHS